MKTMLLTSFAAAALAGCAWSTIAPSPEAVGHVAVLNGSQVTRCQSLGTADLAVGTQLGDFQRLPADMEADLQTLAMNQGAQLGANAVAPLDEMKGGKQSFGMYKCNGNAAPAATSAAIAATAVRAPSASTAVKTLPYTPPR